MQPAVFLDRDGVIIENQTNYIRNWSQVQFFSQALVALAWLSHSHFKIVIVTNQSAVGRGLLSLEDAEEINRRVVATIQNKHGRIDGLFMCPHSPQDKCTCRKPQPGLLYQAAQALSIDLQGSIIVGDALTDLQAGQNAGLHKLILVRTGLGMDQEACVAEANLVNLSINDTLFQAVTSLFSEYVKT